MKILFISTSFPPAIDMHTNRNIFLVRALLERGHKVDVITCGTYSKGMSSFDDVLEKVNSYRTKYPLVHRYHNYVNKYCKNKMLKRIHNVLVNYYAIPDLYVGWESLVFKAIPTKNLSNYDMVITSSGSYTAHNIGRKWKKLTGVKWVAEYGDPWGLDAYGHVKKLNYKIEYPVITSCDGLVFTTQATIEAYKANYPSAVPYKLVPNGYDEILEDTPRRSDNKILFIYTGVAYKKDRDLSHFIKAIGDNNDATAELVGTLSPDFVALANEYANVNFRGRVNYADSFSMLSMSDVVVLIGNFGTLQVPGKTYAYLSSRKPLLYIQQQEASDPTFDLLKEFGGIVYCKNTECGLKNGVKQIIENFSQLKKQAEERCESEKMKQYKWTKVGKRFSDFIESI